MQAIGVDVGGTNLRVARVDAHGRIVETRSARTNGNAAEALASIVAYCRELDSAEVAGVGIGVPGRVDARQGKALSGGFLDLSRVDLAGEVRRALGKAVFMDTDANLALLAEWQYGAAREAANVAMLTIGTGIGGAALIDGKVLRGRMSGAQFGHLTVTGDGLPCACGRRGCVETTSSGTALGRLIVEAGLPSSTRVETLVDEAEAGVSASWAILLAWALPLRAAIDSIVAGLDPERVVLGGGLGLAATRALEYAPALSPWYQADVVAAELGDAAGVIGGAWAARHAELLRP